MMFQNHRTRRTYRDNFARPMSLHKTVLRTLHIFYKFRARPNETAREGILSFYLHLSVQCTSQKVHVSVFETAMHVRRDRAGLFQILLRMS